MHREINRADEVFGSRSDAGLYLMTGLMGLLIGLDLWPFVGAWLNSLGLELPYSSLRTFNGYRFALIAAVLGGARVVFGSLEKLFEGKLSADLAIAIACLAAIAIQEYLVAAEVIFIGLVGECLEAYTFNRTQRGIRKLVEVFPIRCWVLKNGQEVRCFTNEVKVGDVVVVKPGGKVPVDGVVLEGRSAVDVSALTGESFPVEKDPGDEILAGSINQTGQLSIQAQKVSEQTVAGRVIELTARALKDKAPIERQVDQLAKYFVPAVLVLAAVTFLINVFIYAGPLRSERLSLGVAMRQSVYPTLAVLVVSCPCALVLATPAAVIAALGRLAGTGVLIKGGSVLERLAQINAFAFDKTGTLTEGKIELGEIISLCELSTDEILRLAASAEQGSEHPLARRILLSAEERQLSLEKIGDFRAYPGAGVSVQLGSNRLLIGNRRLLENQGIPLGEPASNALAHLDATGQTSLFVVRDAEILGIIGARDKIRPEASDAIAQLKNLGIDTISLLSGDRIPVAQSVASEVKIDEVHAELLPEDKSRHLDSSKRTAFVGDGINDAPALAQAHVGIAIGSGTDVAAEAGDIVMMGDPLRPLPLLIGLGRETIRIIRQNIIWFAFGVNLLGILITAWLWPFFATSPDWYEKAPLAAVIYHQLGSLLVLLNSMRLLGFARTREDSRWQRFKAKVQDWEQWSEKNLSLDQLLHEIGHQFPRILKWGAIASLIVYALSGLVQINADEVGVVQKFGRVETELSPGLHWRLPWPMESVTRVKPAQIRTVEIGFRSLPDRLRLPNPLSKSNPNNLTWASAHLEEIQRLTDESLMITGDGNLVELLATVRYSISNPQKYLFTSRDVDGTIRSLSESILRELIGSESFTEILTTQRVRLQTDTARFLELRLTQLDPDGFGIRLEGVTLHDLHPPQEVVSSFHEVARAIQARDQSINQAQALAIRKKRRAEEESFDLVRQAEAKTHEKVLQATLTRDRFLEWIRVRNELFPEEQTYLHLGLLLHLQRGGDASSYWIEKLEPILRTLESRKKLTEFRLSWDAITDVLKNRDKIIVDADKLPGKRQLFLFDPATLGNRESGINLGNREKN